MSSLPLFPAVIIDLFGSAAAIILSFFALRYARSLVRLQPNNFLWGFLFYFCIAMAVFSLSRGVGHIARIFLIYGGYTNLWRQIAPFSGGFNTMLMISAAAVTIYYHKGLAAYKAMRTEAKKLSVANTKLLTSADKLQLLNTHLEEMVEERTRNLSESEKKFRNFFENSKDIIYFCDEKGTLTNINTSGTELLGIEGELNQINFYHLFKHELDKDKFLTGLQTKGFVSDLEIECEGGNGSIRYILFTANAVYNQHGKVVGCEGIGKDVTKLKTMTAHLLNHEKMASVGKMAAGVAHEINTPLGIILGYTQLMMDDYEPESEVYNNLYVMERQTKACRRIVADLLKFSRQAESMKADLDLNQIIQDVLAVTEHTLNIDQIVVVRQFGKDLADVVGDPEKLRQVFINLFNNAQYAMRDGGQLIITTESDDTHIIAKVQDTGKGIDNKIKNKIFDPFFTTKEVGIGTGLGLSVTYGIVQEHGGIISVESPVKNSETAEVKPGACFFIRLPKSTSGNQQVKENQS